jgi:signal transduction histidine kinase
VQLQVTNSKSFAAGVVAAREPLPDLPLAGHLLLPVAIFVVSLLTIDFTHISSFVTTLWPSNAIILAALLCHARNLRNDGSIFMGGYCAIGLANCAATNTLGLSAVLAGTNILEVVTALVLLSLCRIGATNMTTFRNLLIFIVVAGVAPLGSVAIGAIVIGSEHRLAWHSVWLNSYPAHALGLILVTPFLISLTSAQWDALAMKRRYWEAAAILAVVIVFGVCAAYFRPILFIVVPAILLATVRFGMTGTTTATFVVVVIFSGFLVMGIGQPLFPQPELADRIFALQVLIAFSTLWSLPIAALLTERNRLLDDLSLVNSQLKMESDRKSHLVMGLHRHLSTAEEKERLRLSHELHDQAGQSLVASILELGEIDPLTEGTARQRLHMIRERMEEMGKTLHRIAWELRPPAIEELGLRKALASYVEDWGEQCGTEVDFHCDDPAVDRVPNEIGSAVFRVVQEALTNIVKHAQKPSSVSVVVRRVNTTLQATIDDDGCGFDVAAMGAMAGRYRGLGLDGMRERLLLIGGTLEVESTVGAGTTIFVRIPLDG